MPTNNMGARSNRCASASPGPIPEFSINLMLSSSAKDVFAAKGATEQAPFFSTRSMPPTHRTSFQVPDDVSVDDLRTAGLPEGVRCEINQS
ncbi:hypothetical protein BDW59DRAFT_139401 [Aspergillus cavernicola]|uniref:Uncharacterized protein n=1 Tax=Aspergillus cavernicola TaxID=176166 RepID=A0ABR4IXN8_9EURO